MDRMASTSSCWRALSSSDAASACLGPEAPNPGKAFVSEASGDRTISVHDDVVIGGISSVARREWSEEAGPAIRELGVGSREIKAAEAATVTPRYGLSKPWRALIGVRLGKDIIYSMRPVELDDRPRLSTSVLSYWPNEPSSTSLSHPRNHRMSEQTQSVTTLSVL